MMVPQVWHIFSQKNASGFTPIPWLVFTIIDIPWIIYGVVHKEKPIIIAYSLWLVLNGIIFVGAILY